MRFFRKPVDDVLSAMGRIMQDAKSSRIMIPMVVTMIAVWFIYVPIHELLHVYGCLWTGGSVSRLEIQPQYFGNLMASWFPFVTVGSDYAGRLSGFDTHGSDWIYLATDFGPFALTVLFGVPLMRYCALNGRRWLLGVAVVLGFAPFYNIQGDYYEMGSIMVTRAISWVLGVGHPPALGGLRSDDIFSLFPSIVVMGWSTGLGATMLSLLIALVCFSLGVLLAFATYQAGDVFARLLVGPAPVFKMPEPARRRSRPGAGKRRPPGRKPGKKKRRPPAADASTSVHSES